jgi:hypothetical protein
VNGKKETRLIDRSIDRSIVQYSNTDRQAISLYLYHRRYQVYQEGWLHKADHSLINVHHATQYLVFRRNHQSSTLKNNGRLLNEALQDAKNMANDTYNGLKRTVMDNMVLSIVLASAVLALLILCCYLRRKYTRSAQVVSKREYKKLLRERKRREMEMQKRRRGHGDRLSKKQGQDGYDRERSRMYAARSRLREDEKLRRKDRLFLLTRTRRTRRGRGV